MLSSDGAYDYWDRSLRKFQQERKCIKSDLLFDFAKTGIWRPTGDYLISACAALCFRTFSPTDEALCIVFDTDNLMAMKID